jgi:hypothetical protein
LGLNLPVAQGSMELDDEVFLLLRECTSFEVRPQVVDPPQPAALAAPLKPCSHPSAKVSEDWEKEKEWDRPDN